MPPSHMESGAPTDPLSIAVYPPEQLHHGERSAATVNTGELTLLALVPYSSPLAHV
jgi:hypothetical protein